jgi:prepilin-type N-terminal cleavage/methylation domain-containing protein
MKMRNHRAPSRHAGFSLIELIIVIVLAVMLMVGLLQVFDRNSLLAKNQTQVSEMQQSLRTSQNLMTRFIRMSGRGGLPAAINDNGVIKFPALTVRDNAGTDGEPVEVVVGLADSPEAVVGTDIVTIRGVLTTPVYQLVTVGGALSLFDGGGGVTTDLSEVTSGAITISEISPTGRDQPLDALKDAIDLGLAEALVLVSPIDEAIYAVVELDPGASDSNPGPGTVRVNFKVTNGVHPEYRNLYASGTDTDPELPENLTSAAWIGIVEEYRFYVRDNDPGDPMLSMARMFPGTEVPHGGLASASLDVAENIRELQVALGFDSILGEALVDRNGDGDTDEDDVVITETGNGNDDDWLFNSSDDDPTDAAWTALPELYFVRLNTLARVRAPDREYLGPTVDAMENGIVAPLNTREERLHRRQLLETIIDLRNI